MIISIDYDDTYTKDPETFNKVIKLFQEAGHTVICVTLRFPFQGDAVLDSIGKHVSAVLFTGGQMKKDYAIKAGYKVDVWFDDLPEMIVDTTARLV